MAEGRVDEAIASYRLAVAEQPTDRFAILHLIHAVRKAGMSSSAEEKRFRPILADIKLEDGNYEDAVVQYTRSATEAGGVMRDGASQSSTPKVKKQVADYFCRFAAALETEGRTVDAKREAQRCLELNPSDAENVLFAQELMER
jgi:tetratricopeptide (TPR) repeat protein